MRSANKVLGNGGGFTLVELVVVIVILGILAATALPRFVDTSGRAEQSVVEQLVGRLASTRSAAYSAMLLGNAGYTSPGQLTFDSYVQCDNNQTLHTGQASLDWDGNWIGLAGVRHAIFDDAGEEDVCTTSRIEFLSKTGRTVTISIDANAVTYTANPAY